MNKTARIRILALCLCLLLAFAAIGAGKPVAVQRAVRSDEITTDPAQPEAPSEPETSPDEPEQVPDEPEEAPSEPEAVPDEPEAVQDEPEQAPQGPVPQLGADASDDADFDGIPDSIDSDPDSNVFTGKLKSGHDGTTTVSFTVDFRNFFGDNTIYQPTLATFSVMGAALAYMDKTSAYDNAYLTLDAEQTWSGGTVSTSKKLNGMELMQLFGFEDVADYRLDAYGDDDLCEALIGHKTVTYDGETKVIVAIWVRGTDSTSEQEWSSNFHMGRLDGFFDEYDSVAGKSPRQKNDDWTRKTNHRGFDVCATRILKYYKETYYPTYVKPALDDAPEASLAYWITGHSRGAAVGNLMASYLIDEGSEVYAYTFAAPFNTANTEASAEKYDCIFNLINSNDFIPTLPMPEWGFTRYGKTAEVDASAYYNEIKAATGETYSGKFLSASEMSTLLGKFVCITGENADRNNPGKLLGWREVYVYHCGHTHEGETVDIDNYQSTTFVNKQSITNWGGPSESSYNGYAKHLRKYSYWHDGICETPAYCLQVLVELLVKVANGETIGGASTYITSNKLADKFDFDKWSLVSYATKLTEPHFMDTYSVIQAQINAAGDPGSLFETLPYYANNGRPIHTHTYTYVPYEGHEPTCTEEGLGYRYCLCSEANADYYDDYQKNVPIAALGHTMEAHKAVAATCLTEGNNAYWYCSVCEKYFADEAGDTEIAQDSWIVPALGHDWGEITCTWAADYSTATATRVCAHDETHVETETVETTYEIVTPPTATTSGTGRYVATFKNVAFAAAPHEMDVELPVIAPAFKGQSLTLSGEIGLNFFIEFPDGIDKESSYVDFTVGTKGQTERDTFDATHTSVVNGVTRYGFTCHTNALQMADTVTATLYYTATGSSDVLSIQKQYSVKDYIDYYEPYLNGSQTYSDAELIDLLKALADYGHYAQLFLDDMHDWTLNVDYAAMNGYATAYDYSTIKTATADAVFTKAFGSSAIESAGIALALDSNTALRIVLTMKDNTTVPSITVDGHTVTPGQPMFLVFGAGLRAQNLDKTYTLNGDANGSFKITACPMYYVNFILNMNAQSTVYPSMQHAYDCITALYRYCEAVKAYRNSQS